MKSSIPPTNPSAQPRLTCRIARAWSAWREDDHTRPAPGWAAHHAAQCPDCAQHFAAIGQLENALRTEARAVAAQTAEVEVPLGMEDRIFAAVRPIVATPVRRRSALSRWAPALLGTAAAVALTTMVWLRIGDGSESMVAANDADFSPQDLQQLSESIETFSEKLLVASAHRQAAPAEANGLTQELQALRSDSRAVLTFFKRSFLPSDMQSPVAGDAEEIRS